MSIDVPGLERLRNSILAQYDVVEFYALKLQTL